MTEEHSAPLHTGGSPRRGRAPAQRRHTGEGASVEGRSTHVPTEEGCGQLRHPRPPTCEPTKPGDIDGPTRIKTCEVLQDEDFYKKWADELNMRVVKSPSRRRWYLFKVSVVGVDLSNKSECGLEEDDERTSLGTTRATLKARMLISLDPSSRRSCILCSSLPLNSWWSFSATSSTKCMMSLFAAESAAEQAADEEAREAAERAAAQEAQRVEAEREAESAERAVAEQAAAEEAHQAPWSGESRQERICSLMCAFVWGEYRGTWESPRPAHTCLKR